MRIAYFGGDMFYSCLDMLLKNGHEIIAMFTFASSEDKYDFAKNVRKQAEILAIPTVVSKPTNADIKKLQKKNCDMILSAGYAYKIPTWHGEAIRYGMNIHPSLLPQGAGPMPMPLIITKGLKKTGVTLHKLSPDWDAGEIILQKEFPLSGNENLEELLCKNQDMALKLLENFMQSPQELWDSAYPQKGNADDYWNMAMSKKLPEQQDKDIKTTEKFLRAHRFVTPDGDIEFISGVSFWLEEHNIEAGTLLPQKDNLYIMAATDGFVRFNLETKPSPEYSFIENKTFVNNLRDKVS